VEDFGNRGWARLAVGQGLKHFTIPPPTAISVEAVKSVRKTLDNTRFSV
jgi:hypothetical protein